MSAVVEKGLDHTGAFDASMWKLRASGGEKGGYNQLGWVGDGGLLRPFVDLANFIGNEVVVDVGTGSLAVLRTIAPYVRKIIGFDIAPEMIKRGDANLPKNSGVFVGDAYGIPVQENIVDTVTTRMVYHHLKDVPKAICEARRILKPGGKLIVSEYVAAELSVLAFDNIAFQIKEAGRHLWTGEQLATLIVNSGAGFTGVELYFALMSGYSVRDWVGKSGLSDSKQIQITDHYRTAPDSIRSVMNIQSVGKDDDLNRDVLVDRPFAFVVATK